MRIGINARDLASPVLRGINRYTVNLVQALNEIGADKAISRFADWCKTVANT